MVEKIQYRQTSSLIEEILLSFSQTPSKPTYRAPQTIDCISADLVAKGFFEVINLERRAFLFALNL